jgi:hypothetical protein
MAAVRSGEVVSLALPMIARQGPIASMRAPMQHFMLRDGGDYAAGRPERGGMGWADDSILVACHGTTHLDALAHVWQDGQMWPSASRDCATRRWPLRPPPGGRPASTPPPISSPGCPAQASQRWPGCWPCISITLRTSIST